MAERRRAAPASAGAPPVANFPAGRRRPATARAREAERGASPPAPTRSTSSSPGWRSLAGDETAIARGRRRDARRDGGGATSRSILETGSLGGTDAIRAAATQALGAGADFVKTSTGKVAAGRDARGARVLLEAIRDAGRGGFKASGGVRTAEQAAGYLALADEVMGAGWATPGAFRIGASSLVDDLLARLRRGVTAERGAPPGAHPPQARRRRARAAEEIEWLVARHHRRRAVATRRSAAFAMAVFLRA